ncbi:MAG: restriction endonuclease subunit S [Bacteroidales bacterium]|nr:restriction endonuclease subunit S [Bacteroidales bacterium]
MREWVVDKVKNQVSLLTDYVANGSFASLAENVTYHNSENYAYLIRLTDYNNGFEGDFVYVDEHSYNFLAKSKLFGDEIIISNVGAYAGTTFLAPKLDKPMTLGPNAIMLNFQSGNKFYYYWFRSPLGKHALDGIISGSAQPKFNKTSFKELEIPVPPLPEQKAIASVLSSLDDKIDLLHRQNKILEAMAETLFRQWFIEEANEDWEEVTLADVCTRITDGSHSSPASVEDGYPMASVKDMYDWGINQSTCRKISKEDYEVLVQADCKALQGDILIAKDGSYLKHVFLMEESLDVVLLSSIAMLRPNGQYHPMLLTLFLKLDSTHELMQNIVTGAVIPRIVLKDFRKFPIQLPPKDLQDKAVKIVKPIFEKCWENNRQIQTLENLRDTLLPKLMSGEVRVQYQTEEVA